MRFKLLSPAFFLALSGIVVMFFFPLHAAERGDAVNCEINRGPCWQKTGDADVSLAISPLPVKALEELSLTVTVKGVNIPDTLLVDFSMPDMYMGKNHSVLTRTGPGAFAGTGIIPKCPSGRNLWRVSVMIPGAGKADFFFHVLY